MDELRELPSLVGLPVAVVSLSLEGAADRVRELEALGYRATSHSGREELEQAVLDEQPAVVVVDLGRELAFPSEFAAHARSLTDATIVVVGCTGTHAELVRVLEAGADDYYRPPCPSEELDLRLRGLFRRVRYGTGRNNDQKASVIRVGALEIDTAAQTVRKHGELVGLSPTEYRLLLSLAERPGEVVPAKALIARVWGAQYAEETHYLRLYVRYLRQKLEDDPANPRYIVNRWGAGYSLNTPPRAA